MGWLSLPAVAVALATDAFAVAIAAGLTLSPMTRRHVFRLAFHFGLFQALMPVLGWSGGRAIYGYIAPIHHWIAFGLLGFVGGTMMREGAADRDEETNQRDPTKGWQLVSLSIATSIDAFAAGLALAMIGSTILLPAVVIGVVAAGFTAAGMLLGRRVGAKWGKRVEIVGGLILISLGMKIVFEHLTA